MRILSYLIMPLCVLSLAGGAFAGDPSPIGRGYSSYAELYKSAPGPKAPSLGYEYSAHVNVAIMNHIRESVSGLLNMLESGKRLPEGINVATDTHAGAFYNSFDHALREELVRRGYNLTTGRQGSALLIFSARGTSQQPRDQPAPMEKAGYRDLLLGLTLVPYDKKSPDQAVRHIEDVLNVPAYGYGARGIVQKLVAVSGQNP